MKMCKNGCNTEAYRKRTICLSCIRVENKANWKQNKEYYNKVRRIKTVYRGNCLHCNRDFESNKPNKKFCCPKHQQLWHYKRRTLYQKTRAKALINVYDRGKKKFSSVNYTKKDVKYIIKNYGKISNIKIAEHLGRTVQGINLKIRKLKNELLIIPKDFF